MATLPLTKNDVPRKEQARIRNAVRMATKLPENTQLATLADIDALLALLADPNISDPIYTLPKPIDRKTVEAFISRHIKEQAQGEGLLLVTLDHRKAAAAYHDIQFWPQWSACELGGAIRADKQNIGAGGAGAATVFDWLFTEIGVNLICETAALDNIRTKRLLERLGFSYAGKIESALPSGGVRASHCWEMTKANWRARRN